MRRSTIHLAIENIGKIDIVQFNGPELVTTFQESSLQLHVNHQKWHQLYTAIQSSLLALVHLEYPTTEEVGLVS
jgi:hypothetical protein